MNPKLQLTGAVVLAALALAVAPAAAQGRDDNRRQRGGERATQAGPRQDAGRQAVPRSSGGRQFSGPQAAPRTSESRRSPVPQAAPRAFENRRPQGTQATPRVFENRQPAAPLTPRGFDGRRNPGPQAAPRAGAGQAFERAVPRGQSAAPRLGDRRGYAAPRGGSAWSRSYVRPRNVVPYRPYSFRRPYYSFRSHLSIGFGLWLGYAVPYPWSYFGSYRPRVYGYYADRYYGANALQYYGGLSFDVEPSDADLWVDDEYVGSVGTFSPYGEPLTLMPGVHRIGIVRDGFQTIEFEVTVEPGRVLPYRGRMVPW
jgi:hypothetical protein